MWNVTDPADVECYKVLTQSELNFIAMLLNEEFKGANEPCGEVYSYQPKETPIVEQHGVA